MAQDSLAGNTLMVYYFHGNMRCPTCRTIESQTRETLERDFAAELAAGQIAWKTLNYQQPAGEKLAQQFQVDMPGVVLALLKNGHIKKWNRLDRVWPLVGEKDEFAQYIREEIRALLLAAEPAPAEAANRPPLPLPDAANQLPIHPPPPVEVPLPQ
jgi:hypothetical protein